MHETPLVIFPPWINKFYILDLKTQNSLIKWITEQGYTLFVVSWVNPDASYADVGMEEYIEDGYLTAIREAKAITGAKNRSMRWAIASRARRCADAGADEEARRQIGQIGDVLSPRSPISRAGRIHALPAGRFRRRDRGRGRATGHLRSFIMARTMSFLRSNDLIYTPAIRSYMMGEAPPAFDLLYWNGDGANLPGRMTRQYLRGLCQRNEFAEEGLSCSARRCALRMWMCR